MIELLFLPRVHNGQSIFICYRLLIQALSIQRFILVQIVFETTASVCSYSYKTFYIKVFSLFRKYCNISGTKRLQGSCLYLIFLAFMVVSSLALRLLEMFKSRNRRKYFEKKLMLHKLQSISRIKNAKYIQ